MFEVNRSILVLVPQTPFWHWLSTLPDMDLDGLSIEDLQADSNSYLIDPIDDIDDAWDLVAANVATVFSAELADWCEDSGLWPDLHLDIFFEWFDLRVSSIVTDLSTLPLEREQFEPIDLNENDNNAE